MDLTHSREDIAFREEVRQFITVITQLFGSTQYHLRRFQQLRAGARDLVGESA